MSWRGKRKDEEDHASDGDSEGHAPPKKTCKRDSADDNSDEIIACEISKNRRVTVRNWNGKIMVDIREFYVKDGKQMPGKKVCHPKNYNIGLLAYSPLGVGTLTGKYIDINSEAAKKGRLNLFPGYMERYNKSIAREATIKYIETAKKHGLTPVQLALGFARDRSFVTSTIVGATSVNQLKEDIDAFLLTERPLPPEVVADIEDIFKRYKDPPMF